MKKQFFLFLLCASFFSLFSQEPALAPFYHGVASGDALSDRVILWTRAEPETPATMNLAWMVATDTLFANVVQSGTVSTDASKDYTAKVDVTGLQPDTWYYYVFKHDEVSSLIGRTKTLPVGNHQRVRMAFVSCNNYGNNYFNAFLSIAQRNDLHGVIHLGDYIYEYAGGNTSGTGVQILPVHEIITLEDYRQRYYSYRLDPYFRQVHQQYPFYTVWDDHESANNSWKDGAENHTPGTEGNWNDRKAAAQQAYFEWLPIREKSPGDYSSIYRSFNIGDLAELIMLDTRLEGRDEQVATSNNAGMQDTNRTILGAAQRQWFLDRLSNTQAKWKIVGQQVMLAPLTAPLIGVVNADQWDGYQGDRNRVINHVMSNNIENVVVLTGDIHTSWGNDIPIPGGNYNANTGAGSAFVEFVTTSITSASSPFPVSQSIIQQFNPHVRYANLNEKGYTILDIDNDKTQADWVFVSTISAETYTESNAASRFVNAGERFLRTASAALTDYQNTAPFAPLSPKQAVNVEAFDFEPKITAYPNPFQQAFYVQLIVPRDAEYNIQVFDVVGKLVFEKRIGVQAGVNREKLNASNFDPGMYLVIVSDGKNYLRKTLVKAK